jgi:acyl-CoA dehydrogenase
VRCGWARTARSSPAAVREFSARECGTLAQRDAVTEGGTQANSPQVLAKLAALG